jgi:hypothetical protein
LCNGQREREKEERGEREREKREERERENQRDNFNKSRILSEVADLQIFEIDSLVPSAAMVETVVPWFTLQYCFCPFMLRTFKVHMDLPCPLTRETCNIKTFA